MTHEQDKPGHYEVKELPELKAYLPITSEECDNRLAAKLAKTVGPEDAIRLWYSSDEQYHNVILDGHRRMAICRKHGYPFKVKYVTGIKSLDDAKSWMTSNQIERRNMTAQQMAIYVDSLVRQVATEKKIQTQVAEAEVAKMTGQTVSAIRQQRTQARKVDTMVTPLREAIAHGEIKVSRRKVDALSELSPDKQLEVLDEAKATGKLDVAEKISPPSDKLGSAPMADLVKEGQKLLGRLTTVVGIMNSKLPNPAAKSKIAREIDSIASTLKNWF